MHAIGTLFTVGSLNGIQLPMKDLPTTTLRSLFLGLFLAAISPSLQAQTAQEAPQPPLTRMLFVFDASNSMNAFWGNQPKINTARELLLKSLQELEGQPDLELALRIYGHQTPIQAGKQDCDDTKLEVPFGPNSIPAMRNARFRGCAAWVPPRSHGRWKRQRRISRRPTGPRELVPCATSSS
jgi:hypothetical protein